MLSLFKKKAKTAPAAKAPADEEVVVFDSSEDEEVEYVYVDEDGNPVDAEGNPLDEEGNPILVEDEDSASDETAVETPAGSSTDAQAAESDAAERIEAAGVEASADEQADDEEVEYVYVDEDGNPVDAEGNPLPDRDAVVYVDEDGNEIDWESLSEEERAAFTVVDEEKAGEGKKTYDRVQHATDDLNAIAKEGVATARELKGVVDDLQGMFDFKNWGK